MLMCNSLKSCGGFPAWKRWESPFSHHKESMCDLACLFLRGAERKDPTPGSPGWGQEHPNPTDVSLQGHRARAGTWGWEKQPCWSGMVRAARVLLQEVLGVPGWAG